MAVTTLLPGVKRVNTPGDACGERGGGPRRVLRYVLVRRGYAILLVLLALSVNVLLGIGLSNMFKLRPVLAIAVGASLAIALAWVAAPGIRRIAEKIDRAFFRGAYDASAILEELSQSVRTVASKNELPAWIKKELEDALHPRSLSVYLRDSQCSLLLLPQSSSLPAICASSLVRNRLFQVEAPIDAVEYGDLGGLIPELKPLSPECLVPMLSHAGELLGLIVLSAKRSEEHYSLEDKQLLGSVASQAGLLLDSIELADRMAERMDSDRLAQQDLQIARAVQCKLLPQRSPRLATLDYSGACVQARAVGGDYYDFLDMGRGRVGFVLADIAGKGISSALLMASLQASLRSLYSLEAFDLVRLLHSVNLLFLRNTDAASYATLFFGVYDDVKRTLRYANCGHNPPVVLRSCGDVERLEATATVLGLFEAWDCSVAEVHLFPKDILVIYTDGITEAANGKEEEFGEERLISLLTRHKGRGACELVHRVLDSVHAFSPGEQGDDLTVIVAACK